MKRLALLAAFGLLLGTTGCAFTPDPQKDLLEGTSSHAIYKLPPETLLTMARGLLVEQGYELLPTSDPLYVKTTWRIAGNVDIGASWSRVMVQAIRLDDGRTVVRAYRMNYTTNGRAASHPGSFAGQKESKDAGSAGGGSAGGTTGGGQVGRYVMGEPMSPTKPTVYRANDFEWALLGRVDPKLATHLQSRVNAYLAEGKHPAMTEEPAGDLPAAPTEGHL
ncbi:hypothetical protein [Pyxidicoccus trucidator]|uniref:hypothetical protein n=1 Tax=Pyxidicoccus trucidator TaxID=2709662 RepID=UPI0013DA041A|nr:hypothetical protein [Pyxidicoccus trucidator]